MTRVLPATGLHTIKAPKYVTALQKSNTRPGIRDNNDMSATAITCQFFTHLHPNMSIRRCILNRIVQQVGEHLEQ